MKASLSETVVMEWNWAKIPTYNTLDSHPFVLHIQQASGSVLVVIKIIAQKMAKRQKVLCKIYFSKNFWNQLPTEISLTISNTVRRKRRLWKVFWIFWLKIVTKEMRLPQRPTKATAKSRTPSSRKVNMPWNPSSFPSSILWNYKLLKMDKLPPLSEIENKMKWKPFWVRFIELSSVRRVSQSSSCGVSRRNVSIPTRRDGGHWTHGL